MKKLLLAGLPVLIIFMALPFVVTLMVVMTTTAAAECRTQTSETAPTELGDLGVIDGPVGGPVKGTITMASAEEPPTGDVFAQLMQLRFASSYPTLTTEQARNAITIAQVARDLQVPRYGLQVAIATAIQESKLVNLTGGDRDSGGLFQQRPSTGWGSRAEVTNPVLAARAFFGKAQHAGNPGLLDIPGWQDMPLTQAAQAVQRSGFPDAYAQWEDVAGDITDLLGGDLPDLPDGDGAGLEREQLRGHRQPDHRRDLEHPGRRPHRQPGGRRQREGRVRHLGQAAARGTQRDRERRRHHRRPPGGPRPPGQSPG